MSQSTSKPSDTLTPTVRVMRLYKPPIHTYPCMPQLTSNSIFPGNNINTIRTTPAEFCISQYLLLPDSFGDIYLGELFSAYISVINGVQDIPYHNVTLSARLQTLNATHDLFDSRAMESHTSSTAAVLLTGESNDMVVQHILSELGTHTLRVSVAYTDSRSGEAKTLRKFYRFNVLNPLSILSTCYDLHDKYMVQCQVTNTTKALICIQQVEMVTLPSDMHATLIPPSRKTEASEFFIQCSDDPTALNLPDFSDLALLNPDESYAFAFSVTKAAHPSPPVKSLGAVEVYWSASMGEHARTRGDDIIIGRRVTFPPPTPTPVSPTSSRKSASLDSAMHGSGTSLEQRNNTLVVEVVRCPKEVAVGKECNAVVRITNSFSYPVISQLQTRMDPETCGLAITGLACFNLGALDAGESKDVNLSILPLNGGMHSLSGLVAVDLTTKSEFVGDSLCQIMVYDELLSGSSD